ncbi:MAG: hypothetical protein ACKPKO_31950, partial [Candidatus Fonsibacter sp.]
HFRLRTKLKQIPFGFGAFDGSRDESRLRLPFPLPFVFAIPFALAFSRHTWCRIGVYRAARERLALLFSRPCHAIPRQQMIYTFRQQLNVPPAVIFSHPLELNNVRLMPLRVADLSMQGVSEDLVFKSRNRLPRGDKFPASVKPLQFVAPLPL